MRNQARYGFTLIELLVALVIIATIISLISSDVPRRLWISWKNQGIANGQKVGKAIVPPHLDEKAIRKQVKDIALERARQQSLQERFPH